MRQFYNLPGQMEAASKLDEGDGTKTQVDRADGTLDHATNTLLQPDEANLQKATSNNCMYMFVCIFWGEYGRCISRE